MNGARWRMEEFLSCLVSHTTTYSFSVLTLHVDLYSKFMVQTQATTDDIIPYAGEKYYAMRHNLQVIHAVSRRLSCFLPVISLCILNLWPKAKTLILILKCFHVFFYRLGTCNSFAFWMKCTAQNLWNVVFLRIRTAGILLMLDFFKHKRLKWFTFKTCQIFYVGYYFTELSQFKKNLELKLLLALL